MHRRKRGQSSVRLSALPHVYDLPFKEGGAQELVPSHNLEESTIPTPDLEISVQKEPGLVIEAEGVADPAPPGKRRPAPQQPSPSPPPTITALSDARCQCLRTKVDCDSTLHRALTPI
jgi:hypothetical protein